MKNKRRRKGGSDSDLSDREITPSGSGIDDDTLQLLQVIFKLYKAILSYSSETCMQKMESCKFA